MILENGKIFFIPLNNIIYNFNKIKIFENFTGIFEINSLCLEINKSLLSENLNVVFEKLNEKTHLKVNNQDFEKIKKELLKREFVPISQNSLINFMNEYFCLNQIRRIYNANGYPYFSCLKDSLVGNEQLFDINVNKLLINNLKTIVHCNIPKQTTLNKEQFYYWFFNYTKFFIKEMCKLNNKKETIENFMSIFDIKKYIDKNIIHIYF